MLVYIAGGWFTEEQYTAVKELEDFIDTINITSFKPRLENKGSEGSDWDRVFETNVKTLSNADLVIASTVGKDMGTIWECGFAYAKNIPVVYYTPGIDRVNLMLAKSGVVCKTIRNLSKYMQGKDVRIDYEIE